MDAMERRCQIVEILCDAKIRVKMRDLAPRFNVSVRTIRTDVDVLSLTYPIQTTRGRYNGGIGFIDGYRPKKARLTPIQRDFLYRIMCKVSKSDQEIVQSSPVDVLSSIVLPAAFAPAIIFLSRPYLFPPVLCVS